MALAGKTSKKGQIIRLLDAMKHSMEENLRTLKIIGFIQSDISIQWRCLFPSYTNDNIKQEYERIGDPKGKRTYREMTNWLTEAVSLIETTQISLRLMTDQDFRKISIGLGLEPREPDVKIFHYIEKYQLCKEIYLLKKMAEECERTSLVDCNRACAFYVRKILEIGVKKKAQIDNIPLSQDGRVIGMRALLDHFKDIITPELHRILIDKKFLLEETIHDDHNPSPDELNSTASLVFRAIDKLGSFERKE